MSASRFPAPVVLAVVAVVSVVAAGTVPVGAVAGQTANDTDADSGAIVTDGVTAGGESVGTPVEAPDGAFGGAFYRDLSAVFAAYNTEEPALGSGGTLVTGNVVNLHVTDGDEAAVVSFRLTEDNRITDVRAGPRSDAPIRMTTDRATIDRVARSDRPGAAFGQAIDSGDIRVTGRGPLSSAVWSAVNALRGVVGTL